MRKARSWPLRDSMVRMAARPAFLGLLKVLGGEIPADPAQGLGNRRDQHPGDVDDAACDNGFRIDDLAAYCDRRLEAADVVLTRKGALEVQSVLGDIDLVQGPYPPPAGLSRRQPVVRAMEHSYRVAFAVNDQDGTRYRARQAAEYPGLRAVDDLYWVISHGVGAFSSRSAMARAAGEGSVPVAQRLR